MKLYQVRYMSDMIGGAMALYGEYANITDARAAADALRASFRAHGLNREAKSVAVI